MTTFRILVKVMANNKIQTYTLDELRLECFKNPWKKAVVVFSYIPLPPRKKKPYNLYELSYLITSDADFFSTRTTSQALPGRCLDGYDECDLDRMMYMEGWTVDYCFKVPDDFEIYK